MTANDTTIVMIDQTDPVEVADLLELAQISLAGAKANERPDLIHRLSRAIGQLSSESITGAQVVSVAQTVTRALESLAIDLQVRQAMLSEPDRGPRLLVEQHHAERRLAEFQDQAAPWGQILGEGLSAASSDLEFELNNRLRAVLEGGTAEIEAGRIAGLEVDDWLNSRLLKESAAAHERLRAAVHRVASRIGRRLDLPVRQLVVELPVQRPEPPTTALTLRPAAPSSRSPRSAQVIGVIMPTYGGAMMMLVVPRYIGLQLPGWLVAGLAVAGSFAMGGAAIAAERQRRRARRNDDSIAGLRAAVDAFRLALTKQIRDGVRHAQQELRQGVGTAVSDRGRRLAMDVDRAHQAVRSIERTDDALRDIGEDLKELRKLRGRVLRIAGAGDPLATRPMPTIRKLPTTPGPAASARTTG